METLLERNNYYKTEELKREMYIGQAAISLACSKSLLRYYEAEFSLLIPRTSSGRRLYGEKEVSALRFILKLKDEGYSNIQIKSVLLSRKLSEKKTEETSKFQNDNIEDDDEAEAPIENAAEDSSGKDIYSHNQLRLLIDELRNEVAGLRKLSDFSAKDALIEENRLLKEKLKEKTYELVEARERLSKIKSAKKVFK